jgi:hypothetical protein
LNRVSIASPTVAKGRHLHLSTGRDINKDRNENQQRIAKEPEITEQKGQILTQGGSELRRPGVPPEAQFYKKVALRPSPN